MQRKDCRCLCTTFIVRHHTHARCPPFFIRLSSASCPSLLPGPKQRGLLARTRTSQGGRGGGTGNRGAPSFVLVSRRRLSGPSRSPQFCVRDDSCTVEGPANRRPGSSFQKLYPCKVAAAISQEQDTCCLDMLLSTRQKGEWMILSKLGRTSSSLHGKPQWLEGPLRLLSCSDGPGRGANSSCVICFFGMCLPYY